MFVSYKKTNRHLMKNTILLLSLLLFFGCKENKKPQVIHVEKKKIHLPTFDKDRAYEMVKQQLAFGSRVPNSPAHKSAMQWILDRARSTGLKVIKQPFEAKRFDGVAMTGANIMIQYKPQLKKRILLLTHWDCRYTSDQEKDPEKKKLPVPGADDGASGTAILLELARALKAGQPPIGVDLLFVDLEDQGAASGNEESWCLGSQYWAKNKIPKGYQAQFGILLDMVGSKNALFTKEKFSERYAAFVNNRIWGAAKRSGNGQYFLSGEGRSVLDDHVFINLYARIPTADIIYTTSSTSSGFGSHWHTQGDDIEVISADKLGVVGKTLLQVIYEAR